MLATLASDVGLQPAWAWISVCLTRPSRHARELGKTMSVAWAGWVAGGRDQHGDTACGVGGRRRGDSFPLRYLPLLRHFLCYCSSLLLQAWSLIVEGFRVWMAICPRLVCLVAVGCVASGEGGSFPWLFWPWLEVRARSARRVVWPWSSVVW
jgi:hypothetical protein